MSLLFFKIKVNKNFNLWFLLLSCNFLFANDSIPNNSFLDYCKKSDAYFLYSYNDVIFTRSWSGYRRYISISNKLVVNNSSGIDEFAFLNLEGSIANRLTKIKVRTLKANGVVVELDSSIVFQKKSNNKFGTINYPIPGVEPGDTIETSYVYYKDIKSHELMGYVNLYSNIPSLHTEYTVRAKKEKLKLRYKLYNNFPKPEGILNDTLIYSIFKMENIIGLTESQNACIPCELPYLYYSLNENEIRTWKDVYNQEFNAITQPISLDSEKSSYYSRWKRNVVGVAKDSSKYYQFELLHKSIHDNIQMKPLDPDELIKSSGYFLKEKYLDPLSIRRLYRRLLEDLEIEYSAVFSRSRLSGPIDPYYIRNGEYDHIFFAYDNGKGSLNLLYPNDEYYKYQINEIPTSIYNTKAVIVKPYLIDKVKKKDKFINYDLKLAEVDSVISNIVKLPGINTSNNYLRQIYFSDVDLKGKNISFKAKFSIAGGLSTDLRSFYDFLDKDKAASDFYDVIDEYEGTHTAIEIDSVITTELRRTSPFNYIVNAKGTLKEGVTFLKDNIISISLENLIQHIKVDSVQDDAELDYYLGYGYTDYFMFVLNFPCKIEVLGFENSKIKFKNDFGEYLFDVRVGNANTQLTIESIYKINKDMIPKEYYQQLKKTNQSVKEIKNKRLIIKIKN